MVEDTEQIDRKFEEKLTQWRNSLIDTSKANQLINFSEAKSRSIRIIYPTPSDLLANLLKKGMLMKFKWNGDVHRLFGEPFEKGAKTKPNGQAVDIDALKYNLSAQRELLTPHTLAVQNSTLNGLKLRSNTAYREQGLNTLYVSFGMLKWYEAASPNEPLFSPLYLVPVELKRTSINDDFKISIIDEELFLNPALDQKLRQEFNIYLDGNPENSGNDEPEFERLRAEEPNDIDRFILKDRYKKIGAKIKNLEGWEIFDTSYLGLFSFNKMEMYHDLFAYKNLFRKHPIISALGYDSSKLTGEPATMPKDDKLDETISPEDTFQVLDADSSQQVAIVSVTRGRNLIIQGPPGTGKSQTIANIIAECLGHGKKVLFVSEKMAALEVVKKRLDANRLGEFCLELHSYKANKKSVLKQLGESANTELPILKTSSKQDSHHKELKDAKNRLNGYVSALHCDRPDIDMSVYEVHEKLATLRHVKKVKFEIPGAESIDGDWLQTVNRLLSELRAKKDVHDSYATHPWRGCNLPHWTSDVEEAVERKLTDLKKALSYVMSESVQFTEFFGCRPPKTIADCEWLLSLASLLGRSPLPPKSWLSEADISALSKELKIARDLYTDYAAKNDSVMARYNKEVYSLKISELYKRFNKDHSTVSGRLKKQYKDDMKLLAANAKQSGLGYPGALKDLEIIKDALVAKNKIERNMKHYKEIFGHYYRDTIDKIMIVPQTEWKKIADALTWVEDLREMFPASIPDNIVETATSGTHAAIRKSMITKNPEKVLSYIEKHVPGIYRAVRDMFDEPPIFEKDGSMMQSTTAEIVAWAENKLNSMDSLKEWISYYSVIKDMRESSLKDFVRAVHENSIKSSELKNIFFKGFYTQWINRVYAKDPALRKFDSQKHEALIEAFRKLDTELLSISRRRLYNKLAEDRNTLLDDKDRNQGEFKTLNDEVRKKNRQKAIRDLFGEIPNLLLSLKPCLLMSPMSVSQYIDPTIYRFDVVIFDEASQICPEDAVGAIMRGRQAVIVGDDRQLPPTKFFKSSGLEDDDWETTKKVPVFESILDECNTIRMPTVMLKWHYRSKYEELIAFSNLHLYKNELSTFPNSAAKQEYTGVELVYVEDGVYGRGGTQSNRKEAEKVAELVFEHFRHHPDKSLGVVAFSQAQQFEIYGALEELRKKDSALEKYFDETLEENFFVRNLENVQGDEREVMFFSIGYGKDENGKMHHNFGPLNRQGGERRLNVAITRARSHVKLVSSITAGDIKHTETLGVKLLRDYLEYAQNGLLKMPVKAEDREDGESDIRFEDVVHDALAAEGFQVEEHVGCSGYRLDLAIVENGEYALGIECDGDTYHSGKTARDRDRLRRQVLENLGWRLHRMWSRDWMDNPASEIIKIRQALSEPRKVPHQPETPAEEPREAEDESEDETPITYRAASKAIIPYEATEVIPKGEPEDIKKQEHAIRPLLDTIVRKEWPIHQDLAARRVAEHWGVTKLTKAFKDMVKNAADSSEHIETRGGFYWWDRGKLRVRTSPLGSPDRAIEMITDEEMAEAACITVKSGLSIGREELVRAIAGLFGFRRVGDSTRNRIEPLIARLLEIGRLETGPNGKILLKRCGKCGSVTEFFDDLSRCPKCDSYCGKCGRILVKGTDICPDCG